MGPTALQGPHHSAQKSTSTGPEASSTSWRKLSSVTAFVSSLMPLGRLVSEARSGLAWVEFGTPTSPVKNPSVAGQSCAGRVQVEERRRQDHAGCTVGPDQGALHGSVGKGGAEHCAVG